MPFCLREVGVMQDEHLCSSETRSAIPLRFLISMSARHLSLEDPEARYAVSGVS